ncbi:ribonuclease R [Desulfurispira natronophila]|uniref:Ribonuclease R n=1 Tax=Desulfurispira natronophila TaxID=682562 RepID=A0A7W7Y2P5_9BACT|nr:ribonuclease R [Desulfurispira natronophila]MBB5020976.1 ribonuclease R [Desulfurispira natronophila]
MKQPSELETAITNLLNQYGEPVPLRHIRNALGLFKRDTSALKRALLRLAREGRIGRDTSDRYFSMDRGLKGCVQVTQTPGVAFVREEFSDKEHRLLAADADSLMSGDVILFQLLANGRAKKREIIQRAVEQMAGTVVTAGKQLLLCPWRKGIPWIKIDQSCTKKVNIGDAVVVRITTYPTRGTAPVGEIVKVLGDSNNHEVERKLVLEAYGLPHHFPPKVAEQARSLPKDVRIGSNRSDLRSLLTCTIDGVTARDFDDAISLEVRQETYGLSVHVADVSHYVTEGSSLDEEAYARATSIYFPAYCIPMLPEELSNNICSLMPKVNRYAITCQMDIDFHGHVIDYRIMPSVICSDHRLTYEEAQDLIDSKKTEKPLGSMLQHAAILARILRKQRFKQGSIDFDRPEKEVVVNQQGVTTDVKRAPKLFAHKLIEEFMLVANVTVARHLHHHNYPGIYRIHEEPDESRLEEFARIAYNFGYPMKGKKKYHSSQLNEVLEKCKGKPEEYLINTLMLRSMKRAVYSPEPSLHYGLGFPYYCHFTSPIRRYPDLLVHRSLRASFDLSKMVKRHKRLEVYLAQTAHHCSAQERKASDAEIQMSLIKSIQFMKNFIGDEFGAVVSGVTAWGVFVQLKTYFVEGLIHITALPSDHYIFQEEIHELVGRRTRHRYYLGKHLNVQLVRASEENRELDFVIVKDQE